jgi:hypothetical protein
MPTVQSSKLLLALASTVVLRSEPPWTQPFGKPSNLVIQFSAGDISTCRIHEKPWSWAWSGRLTPCRARTTTCAQPSISHRTSLRVLPARTQEPTHSCRVSQQSILRKFPHTFHLADVILPASEQLCLLQFLTRSGNMFPYTVHIFLRRILLLKKRIQSSFTQFSECNSTDCK